MAEITRLKFDDQSGYENSAALEVKKLTRDDMHKILNFADLLEKKKKENELLPDNSVASPDTSPDVEYKIKRLEEKCATYDKNYQTIIRYNNDFKEKIKDLENENNKLKKELETKLEVKIPPSKLSVPKTEEKPSSVPKTNKNIGRPMVDRTEVENKILEILSKGPAKTSTIVEIAKRNRNRIVGPLLSKLKEEGRIVKNGYKWELPDGVQSVTEKTPKSNQLDSSEIQTEEGVDMEVVSRDDRADLVLEYIKEHGPSNPTVIAKSFNIETSSVRRVLSKLGKFKEVEKFGLLWGLPGTVVPPKEQPEESIIKTEEAYDKAVEIGEERTTEKPVRTKIKEECWVQFVEFLRPYEGNKEGFDFDTMRMAINSPDWCKEEIVDKIDGRDEIINSKLAPLGMKLTDYRDEGKKMILVESV